VFFDCRCFFQREFSVFGCNKSVLQLFASTVSVATFDQVQQVGSKMGCKSHSTDFIVLHKRFLAS
jgi:hypothetical protein